ncbi:coiled-coil domain-containing protein 157 isoform X2 [Triplophysa rosa]|uniref:coiled-coil domain-containing protein 157 isoform X2 n=1 Tax=Triplophysa rosa TaxID=992332 RepID=UPI0025461E9C|nr:coiled-coil domain-containing protein 157 isoform X2 [Triplophysa rosa]
MTHLLGRQDCIDSLRRDLIDLQGGILDVFSETGPVLFPSWKFPGKLSCNLDLVKLLEEYDYEDGEEEFSQHSHIVLLELVVDRLMLLLQSFNVHAELLLGKQRPSSSGQNGAPVSVGPVVKLYWKNLLELSNQYVQRSTSNMCEQSPPSPSGIAPNTPAINTHRTQRTSMTSIHKTSSNTPASTSHSRRASAACSSVSYISPSTCTVSCQTTESKLVPCEACICLQAGMRETGEAVVSLCQSLGLPCSLKDLLVTVEEQLKLGHLSACDVSQWASEQRRDMSRVGKHVLEVRETVEPLKKKLKETETEREKLRKQMSETVNREKEQRRKMEEEWKNTTQEVKATGEGAVRKLKQEQEELKRGVMLLEDKNTELTAELNSQTEAKQSLECERASLQEEVLRLHSLETMLREVKERRENLENELRSTQALLDKERAKSYSVQRQHEALQVKQHALCKRVEVLVQQTDDLQSSLEECEDEKVELADKLKQIMQEKDTIQEQLTQQQSECSSLCVEKEKQQVQITELEKRVSNLTEMLEQAAQRERILVAFPELNPHPQATPQSDVMCDMEQQLKANLLRMRVLQQENASLSSSLARLKDIQSDKHRSVESGDAEMDSGGEAAEMRPSDNSTPTSSSSILHHQTLCLSLNRDAEETYMKIRHAARIRSAGTRRRRK